MEIFLMNYLKIPCQLILQKLDFVLCQRGVDIGGNLLSTQKFLPICLRIYESIFKGLT